MSATVIPFKTRAADAAATDAPATGLVQILEFPTRPYSLSDSDIAALEALASTLDGAWTCEILIDDNGDRRAAFERRDATLSAFFVDRSGRRLRLLNIDGEALVTYANVDALTAMLSNAIGQRVLA